MGLGSTAKKLQQTIDIAEDLYGKVNDLRERVVGVEETVSETNERIESLESELAEQRALVEALAHEQGVDVDDVTADAGGSQDAAASGDTTANVDAATPDSND